MITLENGILGGVVVIATVEADNKTAAEKALAEFRKLDDESHKPLFFCQYLEEV
jgi:hypothetical protein